jgi:hypothetical protein
MEEAGTRLRRGGRAVKAMTTRTMMPKRKLDATAKLMLGKKLRMTTNHNVHVITPHGKVVAGRKGRKS